MSDASAALTANGDAVNELLQAAERCGTVWTQPRAPGKWSPAQLVEHVARALEHSAKAVAGQATSFPNFPRLLRPLLRGLFFRRVLKSGRFPGGARTNRPFDPESGPATPAEARVRLDAALGAFEQAVRARGAGDQVVESTVFGTVALTDYVLFQAVHTRHHCRQLPGAG